MIGAGYTPPITRLERRTADGHFQQYMPELSADAERLQTGLLRGAERADRRNGVAMAVIVAGCVLALIVERFA